MPATHKHEICAVWMRLERLELLMTEINLCTSLAAIKPTQKSK